MIESLFIGWPQSIWLFLVACTAWDQFNKAKNNSAFISHIISVALMGGLLYWGGFFSKIISQ